MDLLTVLFIVATGIAIITWAFVFIFKPNEYDETLNQKLQEKKMASLINALTGKD